MARSLDSGWNVFVCSPIQTVRMPGKEPLHWFPALSCWGDMFDMLALAHFLSHSNSCPGASKLFSGKVSESNVKPAVWGCQNSFFGLGVFPGSSQLPYRHREMLVQLFVCDVSNERKNSLLLVYIELFAVSRMFYRYLRSSSIPSTRFIGGKEAGFGGNTPTVGRCRILRFQNFVFCLQLPVADDHCLGNDLDLRSSTAAPGNVFSHDDQCEHATESGSSLKPLITSLTTSFRGVQNEINRGIPAFQESQVGLRRLREFFFAMTAMKQNGFQMVWNFRVAHFLLAKEWIGAR